MRASRCCHEKPEGRSSQKPQGLTSCPVLGDRVVDSPCFTAASSTWSVTLRLSTLFTVLCQSSELYLPFSEKVCGLKVVSFFVFLHCNVLNEKNSHILNLSLNTNFMLIYTDIKPDKMQRLKGPLQV